MDKTWLLTILSRKYTYACPIWQYLFGFSEKYLLNARWESVAFPVLGVGSYNNPMAPACRVQQLILSRHNGCVSMGVCVPCVGHAGSYSRLR